MRRIPLRGDDSDDAVREVDEADAGVLFAIMDRLAEVVPQVGDDSEGDPS